jgi:ABC-type transporter Mla MlaB component
MLRITVHDETGTFRLALEGRLTGPWVAELEQYCRTASATIRSKQLVIDLTDLEFVDTAGKYLLMLLYDRGAKFLATTLTMRELVREITSHAKPETIEKRKGEIAK